MPGVKRKAAIRQKVIKRFRQAMSVVRRRPRMNVRKSMVRNYRNAHAFRRWATSDTVLSAIGSTGTGYAEKFTFDQLPSYTEFDTLYDRYMITTVILRFQLVCNPDASYYLANNTTANAANWYPKLWYYVDYDDNTAPTSFDEVKQHAKAKHFVLQPNREFKVVVRPAVNIQTYATATNTGYAPKWNTWIDIAQTNVPHYGLKYWVDTNGIDPLDSQRPSVCIERLFYFKCKDVR